MNTIPPLPSPPPLLTYYYAPNTCATCPHILLHESHLPFTPIPGIVNSATTKFPPNFHLINPKLQIPVLILNSDPITEVPAICTAISNLVPSLYLMGKTPLEIARVYEWMCYLSGTMHGSGFRHLFRPDRITDEVEARDGIKGKAMETILKAFEMVEGWLRGGGWAVGEGFTAVDAYLLVFWRWGIEVGIAMEEKFPRYRGLMGRVLERQAVKQALTFEVVEGSL